MEVLKELPNVEKLSNCVIRILGQNPGKFTLQGTNTYLVGSRPPFILIDTGEGRNEYPPLLESILQQSRQKASGSACMVSDIVITHRHRDHYCGLPDVLRVLRKFHEEHDADSEYTPPRIHKFPSPTESTDSSHEVDFQSILSSLPSDSYQAASSDSPVHELRDFQKLSSSDGSVSLDIFHTPGHTPDSICLLLLEVDNTSETPGHLFTGDTVLGQGTAIFADLYAYIQSLQRLLSLREDPSTNMDFKTIYPGHGPVVDDGPGLISTYVKHRMEREAQIIDVLSGTPPRESDDGSVPAWSIWNIVREIYKDYPENLWQPAAYGVGLHLEKLEKDGRARCNGGEGVNQRWMLSPKL